MTGPIEYTADISWAGMVTVDPAVLVAAAADIPVRPPKTWFDDPGLDRLTPLTVESNGRVFGHIASWEGSHIGRLGKVRPPRSKSGYKYFRHGVVETDDGSEVPVGQITLAGGHAPIDASVQAAVAHYDDVGTAAVDVAAGEDRYGIWVAGALRPDVDDIKIRTIKASGVSGDWRPIDNRLELVAICAVNVPGFPIPRALAASADNEFGQREVYALVAAGVEPLITLSHQDPTIKALEYALVDIETKMDWMRASLAVLASIEPESETDPAVTDESESEDDDSDIATGVVAAAPTIEAEGTERFAEGAEGSEGSEEPEASSAGEESSAEAEAVLAQANTEHESEDGAAAATSPEAAEESSEPGPIQLAFAFDDSLDGERLAQEILTASTSDLLWDDGLPIHFTLPQCEAVALRLKFRKSFAMDTTKRKEALVAGAAMPDGRLPILNSDDLHQALLVVPERTEQYAHLARRAVALGFDITELREVTLTAAAGDKYDFKQRLKMVKSGEAMKGGAYPIADEEDLKNAIQAIGRAKDPAATKKHIMKRARALKKVDLLPDKWS